MPTATYYDSVPTITSVIPSSNAPLSGSVTVNWELNSVYCCSRSLPLGASYWTSRTYSLYFNGQFYADVSGETSHVISYSGLDHSQSYEVKVQVVNQHKYHILNGNDYTYRTDYSDGTSSFSTINGPSPFNLLSPANHLSGVDRRPALTWQTSQYTNNYDVYVGLSAGSLSLKATVTGTSYQPSVGDQFDWNAKYYWKVKARNNNGTERWSSQQWDFTVMSEPLPPDKPTIVSPTDTQTDIARTASLQWKDSTTGDSAASYDIYIGTNQTNVTNADNASVEFKGNQSHSGIATATQSYTPPLLGHSTVYYWRIDGINAQGTATGDVWSFTTVSANIGAPLDKAYITKLVALANDTFWYEGADKAMTSLGNLEISSDGGLDLTKDADMVSAFQKTFVVNGTLKKVIDYSNTRLTVTGLSTHIPVRGTIFNQDSTGAAMVIDFIDLANNYIYGFVYAGTFTTAAATTTEEGVGYNYTVTAVQAVSITPTFYNWQVYPHDDDSPSTDEIVNGKMPVEPTILAKYRGKIVQAGDPSSPHVIYMAELGNPFNYSYGDDSAIAAAAVSGGYIGEIGDIVTALIPYTDDYMIIGSSQSLWLMRGDPTVGGQIDQLDFAIGIFDKRSFAWDTHGNLYFLDINGIYRIPPGFGPAQSLTADTIPDFADEFPLTPGAHRVSMKFDHKKLGITICKTDVDTGENENFWFDLRTGGFFPEKYPDSCSAYCQHYYKADDKNDRKLLVGCSDGYIRAFEPALHKDQTTTGYDPIESFTLIGPGRIGRQDRNGRLTQINFVMAEESNAISYELYAKANAETAVKAALNDAVQPVVSGTASAGRSNTQRPRAMGAYVVLKLSNNLLDETWAIEKITGKAMPAGAVR